MNLNTNFEPAGNAYQQARIAHWDSVARKRETWKGMGRWYHKRLEEIYRFLVSPGLHILEIGCSDGNLLAALKPSHGIGVDFSSEMIRRAK
ncbi:MAG TPA: class I SAM-dependent methyltransferase, partial [Anaerolineales bacterium]|nr:class I SAM-dependent methyltransferase [Anaerolineales bacterium]